MLGWNPIARRRVPAVYKSEQGLGYIQQRTKKGGKTGNTNCTTASQERIKKQNSVANSRREEQRQKKHSKTEDKDKGSSGREQGRQPRAKRGKVSNIPPQQYASV